MKTRGPDKTRREVPDRIATGTHRQSSAVDRNMVIRNAQEKRERRKKLLNYTENFETQVGARNYLFRENFSEMGGIWRKDKQYASIHRVKTAGMEDDDPLKQCPWTISYWTEREHVLPVVPPEEYRKPPNDLARLPGWVT